MIRVFLDFFDVTVTNINAKMRVPIKIIKIIKRLQNNCSLTMVLSLTLEFDASLTLEKCINIIAFLIYCLIYSYILTVDMFIIHIFCVTKKVQLKRRTNC